MDHCHLHLDRYYSTITLYNIKVRVMQKLLNISEACSLALHAASLISREEGVITTRQIASRLGVSEAHLAKVLQRLSRAGILKSNRGPGGGFSLSRPSDEVSLLDIYECVEGPLNLGDCLFANRICDGEGCLFDELLPRINLEFKDYLRNTNLAMIKKVKGVDADAQENR